MRACFVILVVGVEVAVLACSPVIPAFFTPSAWAVLLTKTGANREIDGEADLLTLSGLAVCLAE